MKYRYNGVIGESNDYIALAFSNLASAKKNMPHDMVINILKMYDIPYIRYEMSSYMLTIKKDDRSRYVLHKFLGISFL